MDDVVNWESIIKWSNTVSPLEEIYESETGSSEDSYYDWEESRFPCNEGLNEKISLWKGDVTNLDCDVIVHPCNEKIFDGKTSEFTRYLVSKAGKGIKAEIKKSIVKTGSVLMSGGHNLHVGSVLHTASPKFSDQYKTAAENALHNCYRNCLSKMKEVGMRTIGIRTIHSDAKGYPMELGAHIAIRTIRRFLEHWGEDIEKIVIVTSDKNEDKVYNAILPLYFPRNHTEEEKAQEELPRDVGNEFGETVVDERKIRIGTLGGVNWYEQNDIGPHGLYSEMTESPDADKIHILRRMEQEKIEEEKENLYFSYLEKSKDMDLTDIAQMQIIYKSGLDYEGYPVIVFLASNMPTRRVALNRMFLYIIKFMDSIADQPYVILYVHTFMDNKKKPDFSWLEHIYNQMHEKYNRNLQALYVLHPTFWLKLVKGFFNTFDNSDFWDKLVYIDRLQELYNYIHYAQVILPEKIMKQDERWHGELNIRRVSTTDDQTSENDDPIEKKHSTITKTDKTIRHDDGSL